MNTMSCENCRDTIDINRKHYRSVIDFDRISCELKIKNIHMKNYVERVML